MASTNISNARHTIACMGDSLTYTPTRGPRPDQMWPELLAGLLRAAGATVKARNFGRNGNTTGPYTGMAAGGDMLSRFAAMTTYDVPDIAILWGGANDVAHGISGLVSSTVAASPAPNQTTFSVAPGLGASFTVGQAVFVNGVKGVIASKATDALTLTAPLAQVPVAGQGVRQGTQANLEYMAHTLEAAGVTRIVIVSTQYLNYSTGGDTTGTPYAANVTLRGFQSAAVASPATVYTTATVVYCNLYDMLRAIVLNAATSNSVANPFPSPYNHVTFNGITYTINANAQSSPAPETPGYNWHDADTDQHFNTLGMYVVAKAIQATITAQTGWVAAVSN